MIKKLNFLLARKVNNSGEMQCYMMIKKRFSARSGRSVIMIMVKMDVRIAGDIACVSARMESTDAKSAIGHLSLMTTCRLSGRGKPHQAFLVALTDAK